MVSREASNPDGQNTSELKILDNQSRQNVIASLPWNQPPFCWLTDIQQSQLKKQSEIRQYVLGEKIWSQELTGYQFLIVAGKVRLREDKKLAKPLATLATGDWFGDFSKLDAECKAVAATKEVIVLCWHSGLWSEFSIPEIDQFWLISASPAPETREQREPIKNPFPTSPPPPLPTSPSPPSPPSTIRL